jgi:hypothetical protein
VAYKPNQKIMVFIFIIEFFEEMEGGKMGSWEGKKLKAER